MRNHRWLAWLLFGVGCGATAQPASAPAARATAPAGAAVEQEAAREATPDAAARIEPESGLPQLPPPSASTSIGSPTDGRLRGGVPLPLVGPGFRFNDRRARDARYGTVETIHAIVAAAAQVARVHPGSEVVVNDIGLAGGGPIAHHGSHRAGRDADILFFLRDRHGAPLPSVGAPIDPAGEGTDFKDLASAGDDVPVRFDAERTWSLVQALLEVRPAEVQRIFVAEHLRALLLTAAERRGAAAETVARFAEVSCQPGYPHDDHLHVRWFCSLEDARAGCIDVPPVYPWREAELRASGIAVVRRGAPRAREPADVVTSAEAEQAVKAQRPHPDVLRFLTRRKAWEKQPHPGRPYCR